MTNVQKNKRTMYGNVVTFLQGVGTFFLGIRMISEFFTEFQEAINNIDNEAAKQKPVTTEVSQAREAQRAIGGEAAEALRQFVMVLTTNAVLKGELKFPVSNYREGDETLFIDYLHAIVAGIATLGEENLNNAGYDALMQVPLTTALTYLDDSADTITDLIKGSKTATSNLATLLTSTDELLTEKLDRLVQAQATPHKDLVDLYDDARAAVHAAGPKARPRFKGETAYNVPMLVYDRLNVHIMRPTLCNRSGKGTVLVYYTGYTPTDEPTPGKGVTMQNRERLEQRNYDALGPADAPLLLVKQITLTQAGEFFVVG